MQIDHGVVIVYPRKEVPFLARITCNIIVNGNIRLIADIAETGCKCVKRPTSTFRILDSNGLSGWMIPLVVAFRSKARNCQRCHKSKRKYDRTDFLPRTSS